MFSIVTFSWLFKLYTCELYVKAKKDKEFHFLQFSSILTSLVGLTEENENEIIMIPSNIFCIISGITQKALRIKVKHEIWPGDRSIQKETYEYIWQIKKGLVSSFRPLLFFSNNFHKRRLGLKIKMKLDFLRILWGFSFILSNFQEFLNCIGYILSYLPKLNSGLE